VLHPAPGTTTTFNGPATRATRKRCGSWPTAWSVSSTAACVTISPMRPTDRAPGAFRPVARTRVPSHMACAPRPARVRPWGRLPLRKHPGVELRPGAERRSKHVAGDRAGGRGVGRHLVRPDQRPVEPVDADDATADHWTHCESEVPTASTDPTPRAWSRWSSTGRAAGPSPCANARRRGRNSVTDTGWSASTIESPATRTQPGRHVGFAITAFFCPRPDTGDVALGSDSSRAGVHDER
jgi:hypothetical protein